MLFQFVHGIKINLIWLLCSYWMIFVELLFKFVDLFPLCFLNERVDLIIVKLHLIHIKLLILLSICDFQIIYPHRNPVDGEPTSDDIFTKLIFFPIFRSRRFGMFKH